MIEESIGYYEECENCGGAGMLVAGYDQFGRVVKYAKTINVE